jgi:uncharacterized SAM-binding protein YcdF (DUF218 family)
VNRAEHGGIIFRFISLVAFVAILVLLYSLRHPLLHLAGWFWVVDEPLEHADAILVLGDDNYTGDRAAHAAELYREGLASRVVASGRMLRPNMGLAEMIARDLEAHGVPSGSVVPFSSHAANTREEAEALRDLVIHRGWKKILVVTSNYHTRRARFIFGRVFPVGVTVRVSAAQDSGFDPGRWWETRQGLKIFFNELLGYVVARWELLHAQAENLGAPWVDALQRRTGEPLTAQGGAPSYLIGIIPDLHYSSHVL